MSKLYPPVIEGTIPAFSGDIIKVPFQMNKAVSSNQINGLVLVIKTVQSNRIVAELDSTSYDETNNIAIFQRNPKSAMYVGQYYKVQMAYRAIDGTIGYYSTVGVIKYTSTPVVGISDETDGSTYIGYYSQEGGDLTEKVYSYRFDLTDSNGNIVDTSGDQIHNNSFDVNSYESSDSFTLSFELNANTTYQLTYNIKTINGLELSASKKISLSESVDSKLEADVKATLNYENGYIDISLVKPENIDAEKIATGSFILLRASDKDNYKTWNEVLRFVLYGQTPSRKLWQDMTIEQGVSYQYAVQQYNNYNLRSNKIYSNIVKADFEHIFLYDGKRQLKVCYNPKVSSFKNTLLENKVDTIGSKYPFIFRNGNVKYKEFPISGLISLLSDENELFFESPFDEIPDYQKEYSDCYIKISFRKTKEQYDKHYNTYYVIPSKEELKASGKSFIHNGITYYPIWFTSFTIWYKKQGKSSEWETIQSTMNKLIDEGRLYESVNAQKREALSLNNQRTTDLTGENYYNERNFKLEVLDWLTNGEPKLFRSPAEGNYLVRLLNTSLSPADQLGRMLHTFSSTAYEIGEADYKTLESYKIITTEAPTTQQLKWRSIDLSEAPNNVNLLEHTAISLNVVGMTTGDKIITDFGDIVIGPTGSYNLDLQDDVKVSSFALAGNDDIQHSGILTYSYYSTKFTDSFDSINTIKFIQKSCHQFIGQHSNIIEEISDVKYQLQSIGYVRFWLRDSDKALYTIAEAETAEYFNDRSCLDKVDIENLSTTDMYQVYQIIDSTVQSEPKYIYDIYNSKKIVADDAGSKAAATQIKINDEIIDLKDISYYQLNQTDNITSISFGDAIVCEITYQLKEIDYDVENSDEGLWKLWKQYSNCLKELQSYWSQDVPLSTIREQEKLCKQSYEIYIGHLRQALEEEGGTSV